MMKVIQGDLLKAALEGRFNLIIHGCNCHCTMGAGIARGIKTLFPEAYEADRSTVKGDMTKLGTISWAQVERGEQEIIIINAYTQFDYTGAEVLVDYRAVRDCMKLVKQQFSGKRIAYPKIGAGLAGGEWSRIASIIEEELAGEDHTLVEFVAQR